LVVIPHIGDADPRLVLHTRSTERGGGFSGRPPARAGGL
jgi:hypothetical protein